MYKCSNLAVPDCTCSKWERLKGTSRALSLAIGEAPYFGTRLLVRSNQGSSTQTQCVPSSLSSLLQRFSYSRVCIQQQQQGASTSSGQVNYRTLRTLISDGDGRCDRVDSNAGIADVTGPAADVNMMVSDTNDAQYPVPSPLFEPYSCMLLTQLPQNCLPNICRCAWAGRLIHCIFDRRVTRCRSR